MALSEWQREMLEELSIGKTGLFSEEIQALETPLLLIGLGGMGVRAIHDADRRRVSSDSEPDPTYRRYCKCRTTFS